MAGKQRLSTLQEDLQNLFILCQCLICEETIKKPVLAKCGHHFCQPCISQVIDEEKGSTKCPSCRKCLSKKSLVVNAKITLILDHINKLLLASKQELKITVNKTTPVAPVSTMKQQQQQKKTIVSKIRKSTPKQVAPPVQTKVITPSTSRGRPSRRQSAIIATYALNLNHDSTSTEDTPELPQAVPSSDTKVTSWLQEAETNVMPTQEHPISSSPTTQSTLISVSQTKEKVNQKRTPIYKRQVNSINASKVDKPKKDPFEFSQSGIDSVVNVCRPKPTLRRSVGGRIAGFKNTPIKEVLQAINPSTRTLRKSAPPTSSAPKNTKIELQPVEQNEAPQDVPEMLLFQSQSEQYHNKQEQIRLKEIESTNFMEPSEPQKRKRKQSMKPVTTTNAAEEEKMRQQIDEAETYDLVVEKQVLNPVSKTPVMKTPDIKTLSTKKQRPSIVIETPNTSVTSKKVAFNVNVEEAEYILNTGLENTKNKTYTTSPGFTRISKLKSDFKSRKRPAMVPLDVSTTSITPRQAEVSMEEIVPAEKQSDNLSMKIDSSSSTVKSSLQRKLGESFNTSYSSLGAPDFERVAVMENIVKQVENGALNVSDLSVTSEISGNDTQFSVNLIENSLPLGNDRSVELTRREETQESKSDSDVIPCSIPSPVVLKHLQSQSSTQMSQTTVNLLEKLHDLESSSVPPKRKTFSLESDTGDIMTEMESRKSTQEQLMNLAPVSLLGKKIPIVQQFKGNEAEAPVVKFIKRGKFGQQDRYIAKFIQLGYLSPSLRNNRMRKNLPRWCCCDCWKFITNITTSKADASTSRAPSNQLQTAGVQTCFSQMFTDSKRMQTRSLLSQDPFDEPKPIHQEMPSPQDKIVLPKSNSASNLEDNALDYNSMKKCSPVPEVLSSQKSKVDESEKMEEDYEDELTIIERSQEVNVKKNVTLRNKKENIKNVSILENNNVAEEMSDNEDFLQASISQPVKSLQIERSLLHSSSPLLYSSPSKLSTPLMSRNESDANDEDELLCSRNKNRSRKRERSNVIYSDSDSDNAEKILPNKKRSRLSIKKATPKAVKRSSSSPTPSVYAIQAIVRADLEYARTVGPTLPTHVRSCDSSPLTINLDSSATINEMQINGNQLKNVEKEIETEVKIEKVVVPSDALHDGTCGELSENPFFDKDLTFSPSQQIATNLTENALAFKLQQPSTPKQKDHSLKCVTPEKKVMSSNNGMQKNVCKESDDSGSENLIEGTPKHERSTTKQVTTPPRTSIEIQPPCLISVVYSGLEPEDAAYVATLAKKCSIVEVSNLFSQNTTHLVVPFNTDSIASTTFKFLLAVAKGSWVVSVNWVKDSLEAGNILPEDKYEMLDSDGNEGPKTSRLSPSRLFDCFEFICGDTNDAYSEISKEQLKTILTYAGGSVIEQNQLQSPCSRKYRIIILPGDAVPKDLEDCCSAMLMLSWVVESVEQFRLVSIVNYNFRSLEEELAVQADFPAEMLEIPEEDSTSITANTTVTTITQHS